MERLSFAMSYAVGVPLGAGVPSFLPQQESRGWWWGGAGCVHLQLHRHPGRSEGFVWSWVCVASALLSLMSCLFHGMRSLGEGVHADASSTSFDLRKTEWGASWRDGSVHMQGSLPMAGSFTEPLEHGHGEVGLHYSASQATPRTPGLRFPPSWLHTVTCSVLSSSGRCGQLGTAGCKDPH